MRDSKTLLAALAVVAALVVSAVPASAQVGRIGGTIKDQNGQAIKGATVTAENPSASPSSFTATTDDRGRYSIIGLKSGTWKITAAAPGFSPSSGNVPVRTVGGALPPVDFVLAPGAAGPAGGSGITKETQAELQNAVNLANGGQYDQSIAAYQAALAKTPKLTQIHGMIAQVQRLKKDYDGAVASYQKLLEAEPNNDKAKIELGMTYMEKGDFAAAESALRAAAQSTSATREVFYGLGEVLFNGGKAAESEEFYKRAAEMDSAWSKPKLKLAFVALNKGDNAAAIKALEDMKATAGECAAVFEGAAATPQCADYAAGKQLLDTLKK